MAVNEKLDSQLNLQEIRIEEIEELCIQDQLFSTIEGVAMKLKDVPKQNGMAGEQQM